jgi:hypothetical protein
MQQQQQQLDQCRTELETAKALIQDQARMIKEMRVAIVMADQFLEIGEARVLAEIVHLREAMSKARDVLAPYKLPQ